MLQKLGELLQQARQARVLSLEDAERIIRIRRKYLAALERGKLKQFGIQQSVAHLLCIIVIVSATGGS